jgi:hypothetical protein
VAFRPRFTTGLAFFNICCDTNFHYVQKSCNKEMSDRTKEFVMISDCICVFEFNRQREVWEKLHSVTKIAQDAENFILILEKTVNLFYRKK